MPTAVSSVRAPIFRDSVPVSTPVIRSTAEYLHSSLARPWSAQAVPQDLSSRREGPLSVPLSEYPGFITLIVPRRNSVIVKSSMGAK